MKNPQLDKAIAALADEALPNTGQLLASTDPAAFLHAVRYGLKWAKEREGRLREMLKEECFTDADIDAALAHGKEEA